MPKRLSQFSILRGRGAKKFSPNLEEWTEVCKIYPYDTQIMKHFDICKETFYSFLDKQRYAQEMGKSAEFIDAYKRERSNTKKLVLEKLLSNDHVAAQIFSARTYGGLIEGKDIKLIELKKIEVAFKTKQFLTKLAKEFELDYKQLKEFANKFFKNETLDDI